ncbi:MAG TPA: hypothetical protein VEC10_03850 [Steroidobacteraceae bacterium]|nr:hypothetical protein [Steroidobacteraceae bacterium]
MTALERRQVVLGRRGQENVENPVGESYQTRNNQRKHEDGPQPRLAAIAQKDKEFSEKGHFPRADCSSRLALQYTRPDAPHLTPNRRDAGASPLGPKHASVGDPMVKRNL